MFSWFEKRRLQAVKTSSPDIKHSLNSDGQQSHQYDVGNPGPVKGQAHKCGRVKPVIVY